MAESVVTFLIHKFTPILNDNKELVGGVHGELEYVRDEFERIRGFLRVADMMVDNDPELNTWVKEVRDIAHETEDVLDKLMLLQPASGHRKNFYGFSQTIYFSIKNMKAQYQLASEMHAIKSKVRNISERSQRYSLIFLERGLSLTSVRSNTYNDARGDGLLLEEAELVGVNKPKREMIMWLMEDDPRFIVISVVGMGGLGKTTMVKKVYDDVDVKSHFQNCAWINISQTFQIEDLLKDMIYQLFDGTNKPAPQGMEAMNSHRLKTIIKEFLRHSRYLLVLDDVWSTRSWDGVKHVFPKNNSGSRVVLTTRNADVASVTCTESQGKVYTMKPLSEKASWELFCRKTFHGNHCPPHLKEIVGHVLQRCEGLPLAIVAISGLLATKTTGSTEEWKMVVESLATELEGNNKLQSMAKILLLGFSDLPYYLKTCFLYLSIFPKDYRIECMRLIHLWIAEGFIQETEGKTLEDVAQTYLTELFARNLIQPTKTSSDGRVNSCHIHDIIRGIILPKSRDMNFAAVASELYPKWPEKVRRLSIHNTMKVIHHRNLSQLRSLFMFGVTDPSKESIPLLFSSNLRLIKVLDLRSAPLEIIPDDVFSLYNLRYLSVRDTKVKMLPSSIGKLLNLQTLDLKHTNIAELPSQISKLKQLRHLLLYSFEKVPYMPYHYLNGFDAPHGIGRIKSLQKLCFIDANKDNGILVELGKLHQLRRLGITKLREEDGTILSSSLSKLKNLRSLNIHSREEEEIIDMHHLDFPPQFLQRLYLHGRLKELPQWIISLHSLTKLLLRWSQIEGSFIEPLGGLPNLVELQLRQAYSGEALRFKAGSFASLKALLLDDLEELSFMSFEKESLPSLQELTISRCQLLEKVPSGIEHCPQIKIVQFFDMPDALRKSVSADEHGEDYWKISHIPELYFIQRNNGLWERSIFSKGNAAKKAEVSRSILID